MIAMNLIASYTAILFGLKRAYMMQHALVIIGLVVVTLSGNPVLLILGMAFIGLARGSTSNYSNQIVNDITNSDSRYMNLTGVFFAVGACIAPYIMLFSSENAGNWRIANYGVSIAAAVGIIITLFMKFGRETVGASVEKRGDLSFFKKKRYWVTIAALFCYSGL
jgi:MFS family permease